MKFRHKLTAVLSVAAALVVIVAVAALASGGLGIGTPKEDLVFGRQATTAPKSLYQPTDDMLDAIVYYTEQGNYFHTFPDCSGMQGAQAHSLRDAYASGKGACPVCGDLPPAAVYSHRSGTYYHAQPDCSGMKNAPETTITQAEADGKKPCPVCMAAQATPTPMPVYATPEPTPPAGATIPPTATLTPIPESMMARSTPEPTPTPRPTSMPVAQDEERSGMSFGIIGGADGPTSIFITQPEVMPTPQPTLTPLDSFYSTKGGRFYHLDKSCSGMKNALPTSREQAEADGKAACPVCCGFITPTPVPIDYPYPTENITLSPLNEAFSRILGITVEDAFPGYILDYSESYPAEVANSETSYNVWQAMWEFTNGEQPVLISLMDVGATQDGILSVNFPDSASSFRMIKQANEPLYSLYMKSAPELLRGIKQLTSGSAGQGHRLLDIFIHYNSFMEVTAVEYIYILTDGSTIHLGWNTHEGEPRLFSMVWNV